MKFTLAIAFVVLVVHGCSPTISDPPEDNTTDTTRQYKNNISSLYGFASKITKDSSTQMFSASNFSWKDSLGITHQLDELRGKKVLLNFWATWCGPCDLEMPGLNWIADSTHDDIVVIGVSVDNGSLLFDRVKLFAETRKMKFQVVIDPFAKTYSNYGGNGTIPWSFIIDRDGFIVQRFIGSQSRDAFMDVLNQIP
jgi:thiol-disulfide isomerase/thioredoxin